VAHNIETKQKAQELFVNKGYTLEAISKEIDVTTRTLRRWNHKDWITGKNNTWIKLKSISVFNKIECPNVQNKMSSKMSSKEDKKKRTKFKYEHDKANNENIEDETEYFFESGITPEDITEAQKEIEMSDVDILDEIPILLNYIYNITKHNINAHVQTINLELDRIKTSKNINEKEIFRILTNPNLPKQMRFNLINIKDILNILKTSIDKDESVEQIVDISQNFGEV